MTAWTAHVGIFEDKGSWVSGNDPSAIDLDDFTDGEDYVSLHVLSVKLIEVADMGIRKLPSRKNMAIPLEKAQTVVQIKGYVVDDGSDYVEDLMDKVMQFFRRHQALDDSDSYLVVRRTAGGAFRYKLFADDEGNRNRKQLKGKVLDCKEDLDVYGLTTYTLQFGEVSIP